MRKELKGNVMLLITALIWGTAFVAQSEGMNYVEPFTYNAMRTLLGGIVLVPIIAVFRKTESGKKAEFSMKATVVGGVFCGVVLFIASSFQQSGIAETTAGKAGFVTALYIIIVPVIELAIYRRTNILVWICVMMAAVGFYFLCIGEGFSVGRGDILVLCGAFFFAAHIMIIDHFNSRGADGMMMSCIQFFTTSFFLLGAMFIYETPSIENIFNAKYTILYAGIMSSGAAYTLQILGQKYTSPVSATLIMSLESVFAALSGWLILNESLSVKELIGCSIVFSAVILAQFKDIIVKPKKV